MNPATRDLALSLMQDRQRASGRSHVTIAWEAAGAAWQQSCISVDAEDTEDVGGQSLKANQGKPKGNPRETKKKPKTAAQTGRAVLVLLLLLLLVMLVPVLLLLLLLMSIVLRHWWRWRHGWSIGV